jgi:phosphatidate cytidylyltransferase
MIGSRQGWIVSAGVFAILVIASLIGFVMSLRVRGRAPDDPSRKVVHNLNARVKAWWVMIFVLAGALMLGPKAVIILFALISFAALREFLTLTPTRKADHFALLVSFFVVLPSQYGLIWTAWYGVFTIFIPVYVFLLLPAFTIISTDATRNFLERTSETQWGLMICVYCISHVPALLILTIPNYDPAMLIVFVVLVVQSSDVLQYVWGKVTGRHKIAPHVSPSKTVEGFVGGILSATALGTALWWMTPFQPWQAALFSFLITMTGFLGGLVMSAIKRDRGVKDWGHLIEGHGGMLDRLDSVCFAAPIFFHLTRFFFSTT